MKHFLPSVSLLSLILSVSSPLWALDPDLDAASSSSSRHVPSASRQEAEFDGTLIGKCVASLFRHYDFKGLNEKEVRAFSKELFGLSYPTFIQFFEDLDPLFLPLDTFSSHISFHRNRLEILAKMPLGRAMETGKILKRYVSKYASSSSIIEDLKSRLELFKFLSQNGSLEEGVAYLEGLDKLSVEGLTLNDFVTTAQAYQKEKSLFDQKNEKTRETQKVVNDCDASFPSPSQEEKFKGKAAFFKVLSNASDQERQVIETIKGLAQGTSFEDFFEISKKGIQEASYVEAAQKFKTFLDNSPFTKVSLDIFFKLLKDPYFAKNKEMLKSDFEFEMKFAAIGQEELLRCKRMFSSFSMTETASRFPDFKVEDTVVPLAERLFTPLMSQETKLQIIQTVLEFPFTTREKFVNLLSQNKENIKDSEYKVFSHSLFDENEEKVLSLNAEGFMSFIKMYRFLKDHNSEEDIIRLFLSKKSQDFAIESIPLFLPEAPPSCENYKEAVNGLNSLFQYVYGSDQAVFRESITQVQGLFQPNWGVHTRLQILNGLSAFPQEERLRRIGYFQENQVRRGQGEPAADEIFNNFEAPEHLRIFEQGIDVHADDRDERTLKGLNLLMPLFSLSQEEIQGNVQAFRNFLEEGMGASHNETSTASASAPGERLLFSEKEQQLARSALLTGEIGRGVFGPFLEDKDFSLRSVMFSPFEIVAKFWHFSNTYSEAGLSPEALKKERLLCRLGMVKAFAESYDRRQNLICNQGKAQHLVTSVLQGRLSGVEVDKEAEKLTPAQSLGLFFEDARHQVLEGIDLIKAAQIFSEAPNVAKKGFLEELKTYIQNSEMFFTQFLLEVTPQILEGNYQTLAEGDLKKAGEDYLAHHPDVSRDEFLEALEAYVRETQNASA